MTMPGLLGGPLTWLPISGQHVALPGSELESVAVVFDLVLCFPQAQPLGRPRPATRPASQTWKGTGDIVSWLRALCMEG